MLLDTFCFVADVVLLLLVGLSWRWLIDETQPESLDFWYGLAHPLSWEQWAAWMWADYVVLGAVTGVVLGVYVWLRGKQSVSVMGDDDDEAAEESVEDAQPRIGFLEEGNASETEPLLRTDEQR